MQLSGWYEVTCTDVSSVEWPATELDRGTERLELILISRAQTLAVVPAALQLPEQYLIGWAKLAETLMLLAEWYSIEHQILQVLQQSLVSGAKLVCIILSFREQLVKCALLAWRDIAQSRMGVI